MNSSAAQVMPEASGQSGEFSALGDMPGGAMLGDGSGDMPAGGMQSAPGANEAWNMDLASPANCGCG
jgi:hypothetical protein